MNTTNSTYFNGSSSTYESCQDCNPDQKFNIDQIEGVVYFALFGGGFLIAFLIAGVRHCMTRGSRKSNTPTNMQYNDIPNRRTGTAPPVYGTPQNILSTGSSSRLEARGNNVGGPASNMWAPAYESKGGDIPLDTLSAPPPSYSNAGTRSFEPYRH